MRAIVALSGALASGLLLWLASPAIGLGWVAWVALVPAAAVSLAAPGSRLGRLAVPLALVVFLELLLVPALPFGLAHDQWGEPVVPILVGDSPVLAVALLALPLAGLVLYLLRFPLLTSVRGPGAVLVAAAAWASLDLLRTKFDPGGFWGTLYLSQSNTEAAGLAALAGPWLITFALVAVNYSLALAVLNRRRLVPALGVAAIFLIPAFVLGAPDGSRTVTVAAVQPGYDTAEFDLPVNRYLMRRHRDLERASLDLVGDLAAPTLEAARRGAGVVVWPEATVWVDPRANARVGLRLADLAETAGAAVVVPFFLREHSYGATVVARPDGSLTPVQPKQRPMWFLGEARWATSGPPTPAPTGVGPVGTLLGVDTQEPAPARRLVAQGAVLLASSTHDWEALATEQRALARLHARALATPIIRSDWRHGSAIVDADGRLAAESGFGKRRSILVADVRTGAGATPYATLGDSFGWACLGALALLLAVGLLRGERAQAERPAHALGETELPAHPAP